MRKRFYRARVWLNESEYEKLKQAVSQTGLSQENYLRKLIMGHHPKASPSPEYHKIIKQLNEIGNNLNQIATTANSIHFIHADEYRTNFQLLIRIILAIQASFEDDQK